jgi:hypothetical protein
MKRSTATAISVLCGGITVAGILGIVAIGSVPTRKERTAAAGSSSTQSSQTTPSAAGVKLSETIVILPKPTDAVVEFNGVILGSGRQAVQRPKSGAPITLIVRAANFTPVTLILDQDSTAERVVELVAAPAPSASAAQVPPPATTKEPTPPPPATKDPPPPPPPATAKEPKPPPPPNTTKPPAKPPDKGKTPAIPVNPY